LLERLGVAVDERSEAANASVDTRSVGLSTTLTPRNNTNNSVGSVNNGTTAVTLASIATTLGETSTEHVVGDGRSTVLGSAGSTRNNGNGNLEKVGGAVSTALRGSSPASNGELSTSSRVGTRGGKTTVRDGTTGGNRSGKLQESNIAVKSGTAEARVHSDAGDTRSDTTRCARKRSSTDLENTGRSALNTVGSGQDSVGIDESTTAPRAAVVGDADDEGEVTSRGSSSANNLGGLLRSSSNERGREGEEGSDLDHCDRASVSKSRQLKSDERLMSDDIWKGSLPSFIYKIINLLYLPSQYILSQPSLVSYLPFWWIPRDKLVL
jgi:hypothetical protein